MPTGTIENTFVTLHDLQTQIATIQYTEPTANLAVSGNYTLDPGGEYTTRGGTATVDLMDTARKHMNRDIPRLTSGYADDLTAFKNFTLTASETTVDTTTGTRTVGTPNSIGVPFTVYDTYTTYLALATAGTLALTNRGQLATLPVTSAPVCISIYSNVSASQLGATPDVGPPPTLWEVDPHKVINVAMGNGSGVPQIEVGGKTYRNEFDSCLKYLLLGKELLGNFLAVGFKESIGQPTTTKGYQRTYPDRLSDIDRPYRGTSRQRRVLQLFRDNIKGLERQTFRAFIECSEFWMWFEELQDYRPCEVSFGNAIDDATTELTVNVTINVY